MNTNLNPLLLFVTGIPNNSSEESVMELLKGLGNYRALCLKNSRKEIKILLANPKTNLKRGFCILQAASVEAFENALNLKAIFFGNRSLKISKFMIGPELQEFSENEDLRRVILKRIPTFFTEEDLTSLLEEKYGKVRRIFRFIAPEKSTRSTKKAGRFFTYSVEFDSQESAETATLSAQLFIPGLDSAVPIEAFQRKNEIKEKHISINLGPEAASLKRQKSRSTKDLSCEKDGPYPLESQVGCCNARSQVIPSILQVSVGKAFRFLHAPKPTSKAYFACRDNFAIQHRQASVYFLAAPSEYRFNKK